MKSDRKKSPTVSPMAKETEYEVCKACGKLIPFGSKCECGYDFESYEGRFDRWTKSEAK